MAIGGTNFDTANSATFSFASATTASVTLYGLGAGMAANTLVFTYAPTTYDGVPAVLVTATETIVGFAPSVQSYALALGTDGVTYRLWYTGPPSGGVANAENFQAGGIISPKLFLPAALTVGLQFTGDTFEGQDENEQISAVGSATPTNEVSGATGVHSTSGTGPGNQFSDLPASPDYHWFVPGLGWVEAWNYAMVVPVPA